MAKKLLLLVLLVSLSMASMANARLDKRIRVNCIGGYQYVVVLSNAGVAIVQSFELKRGWSVPIPVKCSGR